MQVQPQRNPRPEWCAIRNRIGRRSAVAGLVACVAAAAAPRALAQSGVCALTPESGEGPFYFDPALVRTDIGDGKPGAALALDIRVLRVGDCAVLAGARVDVWHADAVGLYSGYERQPGTGEPRENAAGQTFLRGTQFTDDDGHVQFRTIYPSWYRGRTPHVHFKIFTSDEEVVASQIFLPDEVNAQVFERFAPYRERRERRDTFNSNDSFLRDGTDGVFCTIEPDSAGFRAEATVAIRPAA